MFKYLFILISVLFLLNITEVSAQCDNAFIAKCSSDGGSSVKYIKHFRIRFTQATSKKKISKGKFTLMLNKGNHYRFYICDDPSKPGETIMELSNDMTKFGSNYNAASGTKYKAFDFVCNKTGPYYIKMYFKDGKAGCGVCVLTLVTN
jgi:hypothetical protein